MSSLSWPRFLNIGKGRKAGKEQELVNSFLPSTLMHKLPPLSSSPFSENQELIPGEGCGSSRSEDVASCLSVGIRRYKEHFQTAGFSADQTIFSGRMLSYTFFFLGTCSTALPSFWVPAQLYSHLSGCMLSYTPIFLGTCSATFPSFWVPAQPYSHLSGRMLNYTLIWRVLTFVS